MKNENKTNWIYYNIKGNKISVDNEGNLNPREIRRDIVLSILNAVTLVLIYLSVFFIILPNLFDGVNVSQTSEMTIPVSREHLTSMLIAVIAAVSIISGSIVYLIRLNTKDENLSRFTITRIFEYSLIFILLISLYPSMTLTTKLIVISGLIISPFTNHLLKAQSLWKLKKDWNPNLLPIYPKWIEDFKNDDTAVKGGKL